MPFYLVDGKFLLDGGAFAIAEACCCDGTTNEQWKKCEDDTNAAVLTLAHSSVDYAWLCLSSSWVKCYNDSLTATAATDPTVLEQCDNAAPTECADLVGWPASDDFGGTDCNSGVVDDTNWGIRWTTSTLYGKDLDYSISGASLRLVGDPTPAVNEGTSFALNLVAAGYDQDWTLEMPLSPNFTADSPSDGGPDCVITLSNGDNIGHIAWSVEQVNGPGWYTLINGTRVLRAAGFGAKTIKITYTKATSTLAYFLDGVAAGTRSSTSVTSLSIYSASEAAFNGSRIALDYTISDFSLIDGSSSPIYIDPSGQACI